MSTYRKTKRSLLLHVCCGPCSTHVVELLHKEFDITGFFFNPNIHPEEEYDKRKGEAEKFFAKIALPIVFGNHGSHSWLEGMRGLEEEPEGGKRCTACFRMRLEETARLARQRGDRLFGTTLTISPRKKAKLVNSIGKDIERLTGVEFLEADFKKGDGFRKSVELSKHHHLYRQNYCGCLFSRRD